MLRLTLIHATDNRRRRRFRTARALLILLALGTHSAGADQAGIVGAGVVATVDGTPILRKSLDEVVEATVSLSTIKLDNDQRQQLRRDALDSLIALELLYRASRAAGITVTDAEVDAAIARSRERFGSAEAFDQALRSRGLSAEQLRRDTEKTIAVDKYLEGKLWRGLEIDNDQVRKFYDGHREQFERPAQVRASHILIKLPPGASPEDRRRAQEKIDRIRAELRAGRDFGELARLYSDDSGSARNGGDLGYFSRGEMMASVEEQAFALERDEVSPIFESDLGLHILKVIDRRPAGVRPFAEVEQQIRNVLFKSARERKREQMVIQLRAASVIEIFDPTLAKANTPTERDHPARDQ